MSAGCVLSHFAWVIFGVVSGGAARVTVTWTFQRSFMEEVEAVNCTDINETNESDLQGVHSKEYDEVNATSRVLLSVCTVGFDCKMQ